MNNALTKDKIVEIFEDAVSNRNTAIKYDTFTNPSMLLWSMLIGNGEGLTIMLQGQPLMSNDSDGNKIHFKNLDIYLIDQYTIGSSGFSSTLEIPDLTIKDLMPAVKICFDKHNSVAHVREHHVLFTFEE